MSLLGTKIKPFQATAYYNGEFVDVSDANTGGKWSIFFFYPADFTFVCPTELSDLQDYYDELRSLDVEVFAVSADTHFVHKAWHDSSPQVGQVAFYMVGDPTGELIENFENMRPTGMADRGTFLVDPDGIIQFLEVTSEGMGRNAVELVRKVRAAQHVRTNPGEVCPAKWVEGDATLIPSIKLVGAL
jgi:peroxiredoxin (alkyl hydroperoxide reductase subunit C)